MTGGGQQRKPGAPGGSDEGDGPGGMCFQRGAELIHLSGDGVGGLERFKNAPFRPEVRGEKRDGPRGAPGPP